MDNTWIIPRRKFLGGIGSVAGLSMASTELIDRATATTGDPQESIAPDFGGEDHLRPHILTWGGNSVFLQNKGIGETTHDERKRAVLGTHPEAFWAQGQTGFDGPPSETGSVASRVRGELELARDLGFETPFGRPGLFSFGQEEEWYEGLSEEDKWRWPDGSNVQTPVEAGIRYPDGRTVKLDLDECDDGIEDCEDYDVVPSVHVEGVREFYYQIATDYVDMGTIGIWLDQLDVQGRQRDFSPWAQAAFKDYLRNRSQDELTRLGVEDLQELDIRAEILDRTPPNSDAHPAEDPLYREYTKFDFQTTKDFLAGIRDRLASENPEVEPEEFLVFGNLYGPFENPHIAAILSDPLTLPVGESQETISANNVFDFNVKFYVAAGRFENSGFHQGRPYLMDEDRIGEVNKLDKTAPQIDYTSIQFAEQIANRAIGVATFQGSCCYGPIQDQPGNWIRPDGSIPSELQALTGFAWSTRELLRSGAFAHDVAVIRSIPTNLWEADTWNWNRSNEPISASFGGASNIVMETDRPYDVLIFGHPDLWDDSTMLERLTTYEQVVLPSIRSLSDAQRTALIEALDDGLHVIFSDEMPTRNADYEPLSEQAIEELVGHPNASVLSGTPARNHWNGTGDGAQLKDALKKGPRLVSTDAETNLGLTLQTQSDPNRLVLQVVNYDLDLNTGEVSSISELAVSIRDTVGLELNQARYYAPGKAPETLGIERQDGRVEVSVPELDVWGVVVFGPDARAVSISGKESEATKAITAAKEAISTAEADSRTKGLDDARQFLSYAETGMDYDAFDRTETAARKAVKTARAAKSVPTIGIDVAHNQPAVEKGYDSLASFRDQFVRDVEFVAVEDWTKAVFDELDVLIVTPTHQFEGYQFGFTEQEVSLASDFVTQGGGLLFIGSNGLPDDTSMLLGEFDFGFKPGIVRNADGFGTTHATRRETNVINQTTQLLESTGPSYAIDPPEDATVLYEYGPTPDSYRDTCDYSKDSSCEPDAAGEPFSAIATRGKGTVMVHSSSRHLLPFSLNDGFTQPWSPTVNVVRNVIQYMISNSTDGNSVSTSTTAETAQKSETATTATESVSTSQTTETEASGFGVLSSLTAIGGSIYLWNNHLQNGEDSD